MSSTSGSVGQLRPSRSAGSAAGAILLGRSCNSAGVAVVDRGSRGPRTPGGRCTSPGAPPSTGRTSGSTRSGWIRIVPCRTASTTGARAARGRGRTTGSRGVGSITASERSERPTSGRSARYGPRHGRPRRASVTAARARLAIHAPEHLGHPLAVEARLGVEDGRGIGSSGWRRATSESSGSCRGVTLSAPLPNDGVDRAVRRSPGTARSVSGTRTMPAHRVTVPLVRPGGRRRPRRRRSSPAAPWRRRARPGSRRPTRIRM